MYDEAQYADEGLLLFPLPVEVDAYGDVVYGERGFGGVVRLLCRRYEGQLAVDVAVPQYAAFGIAHRLFAFVCLAFGGVGCAEGESYLFAGDDAYGDLRHAVPLHDRAVGGLPSRYLLAHLVYLCGREGDFAQDAGNGVGIEGVEVSLAGCDDEA